MNFAHADILSVSQFDRDDVEHIFEVAERLRPFAERRLITRVLEGAILNNLFFEPSTRTRISFGCAFSLLGGSVRETSSQQESALAKGESIYDTARVMSGYSDVIVMRHPERGSCAIAAEASQAPVINAGDGDNEHPSQALLDLFTIRKELEQRARGGSLNKGLRIALVGDLRYGRTAHSLCKLLTRLDDVTLHLVSPPRLAMPAEIIEQLEKSNHRVHCTADLDRGIAHVDIIYATRIQKERFADPEEAASYMGLYRLDREIYTRSCEPNTVIMHPLPRNSSDFAPELDDTLNEHPQLAIFRQTANGLLVRMALFALILDVVEQVGQDARKPRWRAKQPLG